MNRFLNNVFIIHVSKGYEDRRAHIDQHLPERGITNFEYMLEGDISDLTPEVKEKYFQHNECLPALSCAYKHILVYEKMVAEGIERALVLEDDAYLTEDAFEKLSAVEAEMSSERNFILNIEHSNRSVPVRIKNPGQLCYLASHTKRTGGYVIQLEAAKRIVDFFEHYQTSMPIDAFQTKMRDILGYNIFWMDPPVVHQGSKNGMFDSELSQRKKNRLGALTSYFRDGYQRHILTNLSSKRMRSFQKVTRY
ncbi:glycosyltransferase family 25 protein (plasmid) [Photobacterium sp. CCB-ST2H9]|uniref:glycosyltransferase family 25 protein n=1 Tax=Photobacterium sp. CCB-ST2H9 TaxID=2912855 RepID=UPI002006429C|nr:glycosyltransferase family 25 protein [Photobacterium sp. CCB-ST2H9]UTM60479.1 glycosyltransferase family 25 protein [Photobacterium sp. CCB-ST2H9]